jgi:hypothetical protein
VTGTAPTPGLWPANCANARISFDGGSTWYNIQSRDSGTQITLASAFGGTSGAYDYIIRMSQFASGAVRLNVGGIGGNDAVAKLLLHMDGPDGSTTFTDSSSSVNKFGFGVTLYSTGNTQNPAVDNIQATYDAERAAMSL